MNTLPLRLSSAAGPLLLALLAGCNTIAETGRSQFALFPDSYMSSMGAAAYAEATAEYPTITTGPQYEMVKRASERIAAASGYHFDWEFKLLDAPETVNAFCLPGGKIAIYSGLLAVTENEDALAAVVGHEVAHATANHGNERATHRMGATVVLEAVGIGLGAWTDLDESSRQGWVEALNAGATIGVLLPYERDHEHEADEIGLRFLVRAGYDPHAAPALWERMAKLNEGREPDPLFSTHPASRERAKRLRALIPRIVAEEGAKR